MWRVKNILKICLWTYINPLKVVHTIEATDSAWPTRLAMSINFCLVGFLLSLIIFGLNPTPRLLLLPAFGIVFALVGCVDIKETSTDSFGVMLFGFLIGFVFVPGITNPGGDHKSWLITLGILLPFIPLFWLMKKLVEAAMNRAFLVWPIVLFITPALIAGQRQPWVFRQLENAATPWPASTAPALLLLALLAFQILSAHTCIQSFRHFANNENYYAHQLASLKRLLAFMYLVLSGVCFGISFLLSYSFKLRLTALVFLIASIAALELPALLYLSLWVKWTNRQLKFSYSRKLPDASKNSLLLIPTLPFEPFGLNNHLRQLQSRTDLRVATKWARKLALETSYRKAAIHFIEKLRVEDTSLYLKTVRDLADAEPKAAIESHSKSEKVAHVVRTPAVAISAPELPLDRNGLEGGDLLFRHYYEAPRGKEGRGLAMLPIWFPVAEPPVETMTFKQIVYRSLSSIREPFRRTRVLVDNVQAAQITYQNLISWSVDWARSNVGASLTPIPISLKKLVAANSELLSLITRIRGERASFSSAGSIESRNVDYCREILRLGSEKAARNVRQLVGRLEAGNAWIILHDDCDETDDLETVERSLNLVFGVSGLSHTPIFLITARQKCMPLSDMQTFYRHKPDEPKVAKSGKMPNRLVASVCRTTARWGSPSLRVSVIVAAVIAVAVLAYFVTNYDTISEAMSKMRSTPPASMRFSERMSLLKPFVWIGISFVIFMLVPFFTGYKWGLAGGSEEVRRASVDIMMLTIPGLLLALLLLIPRLLTPGPLRTTVIAITAAPSAFIFGMLVFALTSLIANVVWLIASTRILRTLNAQTLLELVRRYNVTLHVAIYAVPMSLTQTQSSRDRLPLLLSFKTARVLPVVLTTFPRLIPDFRRTIFEGLKKEASLSSLDFASSSLLLSALVSSDKHACRQCLELLADSIVDSWDDKDLFTDYRRPSTTFRMNALEYAARDICYLTKLEELIVVR